MKPLSPKQVQAHQQARQALQRGNAKAAIPLLQELARTTGGHPAVLSDLANAQMRTGAWAAARETVQKVIRANPKAAENHQALATCYRADRMFRQSLQASAKALLLRPSLVEAAVNVGELHHILGEYEAGYAVLKPWLERGTMLPALLLTFARLARQLGRHDEAIAALEPLAADLAAEPRLRSEAHFELGAIQERRGEYDRAWAHITLGNDLQEAKYDPAAHEALVDATIGTWTREAVAALPRAAGLGAGAERPVFIVGMPRSGTSLVEQILAMHPDVAGGGERARIFQLVNEIQPRPRGTAYIDDVSRVTPTAVSAAAKAYLADLLTVSRSARRVTDKQPFNFLYLGMIRLMFPEARIIHCRRDPLDVAVSCFFQSFDNQVWFANRLPHIAHFHAQYVRLMDHWRAVLDGPLLELDYEALVADQDAHTRRMVEFIGLDWNDACLRFHESDRVAWTASIDQVRKPMYASSVRRWQRYEKHLPALRAAMGR